jgi:hypothetical protein
VGLTRYQLDVLHGPGLACVGAEPGPQQVSQDVALLTGAVGDVQRDLDKVADSSLR